MTAKNGTSITRKNGTSITREWGRKLLAANKARPRALSDAGFSKAKPAALRHVCRSLPAARRSRFFPRKIPTPARPLTLKSPSI